MTKLNQRKIDWVMRALNKDELSVNRIAKTQKITARRVRQLREYMEKTGEVFSLKTERKTCIKPLAQEEIRMVNDAREKYKSGSTLLEKIIEKEYKVHIPHNRIQDILEIGGFTVPPNKKVKRKDWIRYERKHSNSMWHTDWTQLDDGRGSLLSKTMRQGR